MITAFRGRWTRLGNYSSCVIFYNGHAYNSVEHAYQASKFSDRELQRLVREQPTAGLAKKTAWRYRSLWRVDWDDIKLDLMETLLREKFSQEPERAILLSTQSETLIEGNYWNDTFWGQCPLGNGENWLGILLMKLRDELGRGSTLVPPSETFIPERRKEGK